MVVVNLTYSAMILFYPKYLWTILSKEIFDSYLKINFLKNNLKIQNKCENVCLKYNCKYIKMQVKFPLTNKFFKKLTMGKCSKLIFPNIAAKVF